MQGMQSSCNTRLLQTESEPACTGRGQRNRRPTDRARESAEQAAAEREDHSVCRKFRSCSPALQPGSIKRRKLSTLSGPWGSTPSTPRMTPSPDKDAEQLEARISKVDQVIGELKEEISGVLCPGALPEAGLAQCELGKCGKRSSPGTPEVSRESTARGISCTSSSDEGPKGLSGAHRRDRTAARTMVGFLAPGSVVAPPALPPRPPTRRKPLRPTTCF
eukprot:jgi/Botrbrau1/2542/Bobra.0079s0029.1